jgi:uncharacterized spore protein YtfJ
MRKKILALFAVSLLCFAVAFAQAPAEKKSSPPSKVPLPMDQLAEAMAQRLTKNLGVKTIVGEPMKVGKVTIIPIMMIDIGFGGGGGGAPQSPAMGGKGFYMSGEARPIGFVIVGKAGTKFVSAGKIPRN